MSSDLPSAERAIASVVERYVVEAPATPGVCVAMTGPEGDCVVTRGVANVSTNEPLSAVHGVRIASCTKTFVASVILDLVVEGTLSLDQPVIEAVPPRVAALLAAHGTGEVITVRQLLQHRSGLIDPINLPELLGPEADDHDFEWTAIAQLAIALARPSLFAPGDAFSYSDPGYVLLGQVIEHLTASSLAAAVRERLHLDRLDVPSIHWERAEPTPAGVVRAHQYLDGVDTYDWNPTLDLFGGGGIVATMPDLARWWSLLFDGRVHAHLAAQLGDTQSTGPQPFSGGDTTGLGLFHRHVDGVEVWSHGGYWGLQALHIPAARTSVALVVTARGDGVPGPGVLADQVITALAG